jgi:hypothetical protein
MAQGQLPLVLRHLRQLAGAGVDDSDRRLLECFAERHDEAAFAALVRRHGPMVHGVCRRVLGNAHDADDAFQATFLVLARKADALLWQASVRFRIRSRSFFSWSSTRFNSSSRRFCWKKRNACLTRDTTGVQ